MKHLGQKEGDVENVLHVRPELTDTELVLKSTNMTDTMINIGTNVIIICRKAAHRRRKEAEDQRM